MVSRASLIPRASSRGTIDCSASITRWAYWIAINGERNCALASSKFSLSTQATYSGANLIAISISPSILTRRLLPRLEPAAANLTRHPATDIRTVLVRRSKVHADQHSRLDHFVHGIVRLAIK